MACCAESVANLTTSVVVSNAVTSFRPSPAKVVGFNGSSLMQQRGRMVHRVKQSKRFAGVFTRASSDTATAPVDKIAPAIILTEKAVSHLKRLKGDKDALYLRVGVRQGGCSGMSYVMDFEDESKVRVDDSKIEADGITLICDPKSLLFLFGMQLDYSDALIGGGFAFSNPNATSTCGCGKSFAA
ncbi:hypothetical protein Mapa_014866 [Marchantia paleacea]|nr:hypothetical protein Mapa_014866 [Marchantia paleacea]